MDWEDIAQKILRKYYTLFDRRLNLFIGFYIFPYRRFHKIPLFTTSYHDSPLILKKS